MSISDLSSDVCSSDIIKGKIMKELLKRFRPEFINRLDQVVIFQPLVRNIISKILAKQLAEKKKLLEKRLNISVILTTNAFEFLLNESFDLAFGARQISRTLHTYFETPLIDFVSKSMGRSEEHTSELQSLIRIYYAV